MLAQEPAVVDKNDMGVVGYAQAIDRIENTATWASM